MPKTKKRKKTTNRVSTEQNGAVQTRVARGTTGRAVPQAGIFGGGASMQNLVFTSMVALGFWGFAVFCIFFFAVDPNHYLYGGIMALTALVWTFMVARKWSQYRQRA